MGMRDQNGPFVDGPFPIGSMYGIFTYMIFMVNVGKNTVHGSYGFVGLEKIAHLMEQKQISAAWLMDEIPLMMVMGML